MSLAAQVAAGFARVATEFNTLRSSIASSLTGKADDSTVVKLTGAQTVAGIKTFSSAPLVPTPGSPGNPVRNDDIRNSDARTPLDGSVTNAKVAGGAGIEEAKLSLASDAAAGIASRRTLGTGATQAAAGNHTHSGYASTTDLAGYVPTSQRGPIGGVVAPSYAATVTPDATAGVHFRYVATGALAVAVPTGGIDGQRILIEIQASGAARTVTFNGAYELSSAVPSNIVTVSSGQWGYAAAVNRGGTWRLVSADPTTVSIDASAITTGTVDIARLPVSASAATAIAGSIDVQVFSTSGSYTWTKPAGAMSVHVLALGGGGGGGGGGRAPSGTAYSGGGGGGGGSFSQMLFPAASLNPTESVQVGAGGAGGTAATTNSSTGGSGGNGGPSVFGSLKVVSWTGHGGTGGGSAASVGGGVDIGMIVGGSGAGTVAGGSGVNGGSPVISGGGGGGGSGAGLAATQVALGGGGGGTNFQISTSAPSVAGGGATGTATGTDGLTWGGNVPIGGSGGGGGGSRTTATAGDGGNGGAYSGGGGGGGTASNGRAAGAGGNGATGVVVVTTYF